MSHRHKLSAKAAMALEDGPANIFTKERYTDKYKKILRGRRERLPVAQEEARQTFLDVFQKTENQVVVLSAETGSGKTTQIPQIVALDLDIDQLAADKRMVACTQPRRMAVSSMAERVAEEADVKLGEEVGYAYRGVKAQGAETIITFLTDGLLLAKAKTDPHLKKYAAVLLDEAHERTASTDILMAHLKWVVKVRPEFKLIIMSATLSVSTFKDYYPGAEMVKLEGKTFPVDIFFLETPCKTILESAAKKVLDIHRDQPAGDILVFVSGTAESHDVWKTIDHSKKTTEYKALDLGPLTVYEVSAQMSKQRQDEIVNARPAGRKVIIATNVAETSLTFDGLVYVIDTGMVKSKVYNPREACHNFHETAISQAAAKQRAGRAGRTAPGKVYRMYTQAAFESFQQNSVPSILEGPMSAHMLNMYALKYNPFLLELPSQPAAESMVRGAEELAYLLCVKADGMTPLGEQVSSLGIEPRLAVSLWASSTIGCSGEIASIIAVLEADNSGTLWPRPILDGEKSDQQRAQVLFSNNRGYHLSLLTIYEAWRDARNKGTEKEFCKSKVLDMHTLQQADTARARIRKGMDKVKWPLRNLDYNDPDYDEKIVRALCKGHFMQAARKVPVVVRRDGKQGPNNLFDIVKSDLRVTPAKAIFDPPDYSTGWVIFEECCRKQPGPPKISGITPVMPEWLVESCYLFFDLEHFPDGDAKENLNEVIRGLGYSGSAASLNGRKPPPRVLPQEEEPEQAEE